LAAAIARRQGRATSEPLHAEYGSYAVQKGNTALAEYLNAFICKEQKSGDLAKFYQATMGGPLKAMPSCP
jgi:hypothetical protein